LEGETVRQDSEAYKESLRNLVGETYWKNAPAIFAFQREHMSRPGALAFALEHCQFTDQFPRWFGNVIGNCPVLPVRAYMVANMFVEEVEDPTMPIGHNESMWVFARALGATEDEIRNYVPLITTTMALRYFDAVSRTLPWLEAFTSVALLELVTNAPLAAKYGQIPINSRQPFEKLGLSDEELSHWSAAEAADHGVGDTGPGHGEDALALLATYATTEEAQQRCAQALREAVAVVKYQYDQIGLLAIDAAKRVK
jgi:pyrroloquinoline quinone (PQQ) biosynthesis protein C